MARTAITPQRATAAGLGVVFEPANADGNSFKPQTGRLLLVRNGGGSPMTVTVPTPGTVDGLAIADRAVSVPASGERLIALSDGSAYRQPGGAVHVDYSATTSVTVAIVDVP